MPLQRMRDSSECLPKGTFTRSDPQKTTAF